MFRHAISRRRFLHFSGEATTGLALATCSFPLPTPSGQRDRAGAEQVIFLGAAVSETGKYSREGQDTRQGYVTWLEWVNNEYGGIKVGEVATKWSW